MTVALRTDANFSGNISAPEICNPRMPALLLIPSLIGAAAKYVVLRLLRHADEMGFRAELAVLDGRGLLCSSIPLGVTLHDLGKRSRWGILPASRNLRRLLMRHPPEIVVSFLPLANIVAR
jgi:hypothetical protein